MKKKLNQAYKKGYREAIFDVIGCITISAIFVTMFIIWW